MKIVMAVARPKVVDKATAPLADAGITAVTRPDYLRQGLAETAILVHGFSGDIPKTRRS